MLAISRAVLNADFENVAPFWQSALMLDLPDQPILDKQKLIGGCVRLPLRIDATKLHDEVAALTESMWGSTGGRVGVHRAAEAIFLRGHAPAEGDRPIEERPALALLPYTREIIEKIIPSSPLRCLLARMPAGAVIAPHIDQAPYFAKSLRIHVPVETNDQVHMVSDGQCYKMRVGEAWVLNNNATHAVWNAHPSASRTHIICDFIATPALLSLLALGERKLGQRLAFVDQHLLA